MLKQTSLLLSSLGHVLRYTQSSWLQKSELHVELPPQYWQKIINVDYKVLLNIQKWILSALGGHWGNKALILAM